MCVQNGSDLFGNCVNLGNISTKPTKRLTIVLFVFFPWSPGTYFKSCKTILYSSSSFFPFRRNTSLSETPNRLSFGPRDLYLSKCDSTTLSRHCMTSVEYWHHKKHLDRLFLSFDKNALIGQNRHNYLLETKMTLLIVVFTECNRLENFKYSIWVSWDFTYIGTDTFHHNVGCNLLFYSLFRSNCQVQNNRSPFLTEE